MTNAQEIPEIVARAFRIATSGRPGPVLIDITKNAQIELCDFHLPIKKYVYKHVTKSFKRKLRAAADLLNSAQRPYILMGHGVALAKAEEAMQKLAEKGNFPVASTLLGLSSMATNHPLYMGMLGMHGNYGPNKLTNKADVILAIGMRFDDRVTGKVSEYAKDAKIILNGKTP